MNTSRRLLLVRSGAMRDVFTGPTPYRWPYLIFGGSILVSGAILFAIPTLQKRKEQQNQLTEQQLHMGVVSYSRQNIAAPDEQQQL